MSRTKDMGASVLLALDLSEAVFAKIARSGDGYPPFDVERLAPEDGQSERLRITLAVAGFAEQDLEVFQEAGQLVIRGRQSAPDEIEYLFRGIARRQFQRNFVLPTGMEVLKASLRKGLLIVELAVPENAQAVRKINISRS